MDLPPPPRIRPLVAVLLGTLVVPLDSAVNIAFPSITQAFGLPIARIQWLVISYTLTFASLMLVFGRLGDMLGHRRVFMAGAAWSAAAFALCGSAQSYVWLLVCRVLQGVGAGMIMSCGPALVTSLHAEERRARALGLYTTAFGIGGAVGPALGGILVARFGWSAVFWFRAPVALASLLLAFPLPSPARRPTHERFDAWGAILLVLATVGFLLALNEAASPPTLTVFGLVGVLAVWGFIRRERTVAHPIIELRLFRSFDFAFANLASALMNLAGFAMMLLVPFALARIPGISIPVAGAVLAASQAGVAAAAPIGGRLADRAAPARLMLVGGLLLGAGLFAVADASSNPAALAAAMLIAGLGLGLFQVAYLDKVTGAIPISQRGVAGSLGMLTRTLGLVTGAVALMLVFQAARAAAEAHGVETQDTFAVGFRAALRAAAAIPFVLALVFLFRSRAHGRST